MSWVDNTIWWHLYPLGFVGAPIRDQGDDEGERHRLLQVIDWLDYATQLGVSGILFGPLFLSSSHGYDTLDQFTIDPRLGTEEDFDLLLAECKKRGLRVLLDGVFSHVGSKNPQVLGALAGGPDSPDADLFDIDWDASGGPQPRVFEGHGSLVRLNHASPAAQTYVSEVINHWLGKGIDGWRLDAAYSVAPWFWAKILPAARESYPDAWFLGEVIHGDYVEFVEESTVDSVTQYELWKAIWSSILDENFFELDWGLKRHNDFLEHFVPNTFVGNHDVTRIASTLGPNGAVIAFAILMTVGGIPSVYYGDEQGFTGIKEENIAGDDAIRPKMPETPDGLLGFGKPTLESHKALISIRRRNPWLVRATTEPVLVEHTRYVYRTVSEDGSRHIETDISLEGSGKAVIRDQEGVILWGKPVL